MDNNHDEMARRARDLNFLPEPFRLWIERAKAPTEEGRTWRKYTFLMVGFAEAFSRAPLTSEDCKATNILAHFDAEIDHLLVTARQMVQCNQDG